MSGWSIAFIALTACRISVAWCNDGKEKPVAFRKWDGWGKTWVTAIDIFILYKAGLFG